MDNENTEIEVNLEKALMIDNDLFDDSVYLRMEYQDCQYLSKVRKKGKGFNLNEKYYINV